MAEKEKNEELEKNAKKAEEKVENKKGKKQQEIVPKSEYDELDDRYKRILAEFENYKREVEKKEKTYIIQYYQML